MFRRRKKLKRNRLGVSHSGIAVHTVLHYARQFASDLLWVLFGVCMVTVALPARGQCAEEQKLTASDAATGDAFGWSVSVSGDTVVVGSHLNDDAGNSSGSAYVFVHAGGLWIQQQKLTASDAAANDNFGFSVSVSGGTVVVGAHLNDDAGPGSDSGSAYVFVRSGGVWTQQQKLTASDAAADDFFGRRVSVSGDTAVVGALGNDDAGADSGSAYVFVRSGSVWTQQQKLTASDAAANDNFGWSVSVSGDTAVIGTWRDDGVGTDSGSAYVFVRSGSVWTQQQKLTASDAAANDYFGWSVSVSGDTAAVGAIQDDDAGPGTDSGSAYVFVRSGSVWTQQQKLTASDAATDDFFGASVSVSGDTVVVGAYNNDDAGPNSDSGSAYVFVHSGGVWTQQQKLTASDAAASDRFGYSISVNEDKVVVGAYENDDGGANSGSAYMFSCALPCSPPDCNNHGMCDNGACLCDTGFAGAACDQCALDYYNYPTCTFCLASTTCSGNGTCDSMGSCDCNSGFSGPACACGNGAVDAGEQCDDGNAVSGDCCSSVCTFESTSTNCRAAAGDCDLDEFCDGLGNCPADAKSTAECRISTGVCDPAESCDGVGNACPPDLLSTSECRASSGVCDPAEVCDGVDVDCPADVLDTSECRGSTGPCDPAENCDGINGICPSDLVITDCIHADGCCATGCNNTNDDDCAAVCGNNVPEAGEGCDDGNLENGDGCTSTCEVEPDPPVADPTDKTRFISFAVPAGSPAPQTALRVTLRSLHHVDPPYSGGPSIPFTSFEGQVRWVGSPVQYVESGASGIPFYAARLQCGPHYQDWSTVGLLHVTGSAITPSSMYEVENVSSVCTGAESSCVAVSAPLTVATTRWGDVRSPYNPPDGSVQPDISDVSALVDKFRNAPGAPIKTRGILAGAPGNPFGEITHEVLNVDFGFSHISACVDAFRGAPYPYTISACP